MDNDIPAVRNVRIEVVMIPWLVLTSLLVILLIYFLERVRNMLDLSQRWRGHRLIVVVRSTF